MTKHTSRCNEKSKVCINSREYRFSVPEIWIQNVTVNLIITVRHTDNEIRHFRNNSIAMLLHNSRLWGSNEPLQFQTDVWCWLQELQLSGQKNENPSLVPALIQVLLLTRILISLRVLNKEQQQNFTHSFQAYVTIYTLAFQQHSLR